MKVALFDVCHTLVRANTTFDFLSFYFEGDETYRRFKRKRESLSGRLRAKFGDNEQTMRYAAISFLEGEPEERVKLRAAEFVERLEFIEPTGTLLKQWQGQGDEVVLVSASLDVVVAAVAKKLVVERYFASELKFENDVCLGALDKDLLGNKAELISSRFDGDDLTMVTDNFSDENCISVVKNFVPVYQQGNTRAKRFWRSKPTEVPLCYD